ncbi:MAG: transcription termination/antitermination NusG family protein [Gammaproteobacteria bacterium]
MKYWLVATYKINEIKRVEENLSNQNFNYYLPKIVIKKVNSCIKEEVMFPGYIFIQSHIDEFSSLKYTKGIKNIIKFGKNISFMTDAEIRSINKLEESSKLEPIISEPHIGQEVMIKKGSLKGNLAKICSFPSKNRIGILLYFLGSQRRITILRENLEF